MALVVCCLVVAAPSWADTLRIVPLVRDGQLLVSCHLADGYTSDVRDVVQSGLRTTFTYTVELRLKVPVWVDRTIDSAVVTTTVQFDNLTRRHSISRLIDGRVEDARVTEDEATVREWLTAFDKLPLFRTSRLEPNREYLRRRARRRPSEQRCAVLAVGDERLRPDEVHLHSIASVPTGPQPNAGQAWSRAESNGFATGHVMPNAGSFHRRPASCSGAYSLVIR